MNGCAASVGKDRIRYLVLIHGRWYWRPTKNHARGRLSHGVTLSRPPH
jgi:hypothetical protein